MLRLPWSLTSRRYTRSLASILVCRFMLSLRQFDASVVSATESGAGSQAPDHMASTVLQFGAEPSDTLPSFIASFAHPVHVDKEISEDDSDPSSLGDDSEWREMGVVASASGKETLSQGSTLGQSYAPK